MPIHKPAQKEHAKYLYLRTAYTQKEIAEAVEVDPKTIYRWIYDNKWEEEKKRTYFSPDRVAHNLYEELRQIDDIIHSRENGKRYATKEELEVKAKILNLISGPLKNTADKWRNITPRYPIEESFNPDTDTPRGFNIIIDGIDPRDVPDF